VFIHDLSSSNIIGGTTPAERNIISGTGGVGVHIAVYFPGNRAGGNQVTGNYIGTDPTGTFAIGNGSTGVAIDGGFNNIIGGTAAGAGNLISGNGAGGVQILGQQTVATGNVVQGNLIGTQADGISPLGNNGSGVSFLSGAQANTIGGTEIGTGNVIAFNNLMGAGEFSTQLINPGTIGNFFRRNSIFSNGGLGIDVGDPGITPNDTGDGDQNRQNFPLVTSATTANGIVTINGSLNSTANTTHALEFFANEVCDDPGYGEGKIYIGTSNLVTDASGNANFNVSYPSNVPVSHLITATATSAGSGTSEFSQCLVVRDANNSPCSYLLSSSNRTSPAGTGETITVGVFAQDGCRWTAISTSDFISVSSGPSASGNGVVTLVVPPNASGSPRTGTVTIAGQTFIVNQPESKAGDPTIGFLDPFRQVVEGAVITFTVTRGGDTSRPASVNYHTADADTFKVGCAVKSDTAFGRCDFSTTTGRLDFAAHELEKTLTISIVDDGYVEYTEGFQIVLSNPSAGVALGG
jgi:hypothetical protein